MWKGLYLYYALSKNNLSIRKLSLPGATSFVELKTFKAADSSQSRIMRKYYTTVSTTTIPINYALVFHSPFVPFMKTKALLQYYIFQTCIHVRFRDSIFDSDHFKCFNSFYIGAKFTRMLKAINCCSCLVMSAYMFFIVFPFVIFASCLSHPLNFRIDFFFVRTVFASHSKNIMRRVSDQV